MDKLPKIASKQPLAVKVEEGKSYYWCSCGLSAKQPFCDGAHKKYKDDKEQPIMKPTLFISDKEQEIYFCGCKKSKKGALCDGSHNNL